MPAVAMTKARGANRCGGAGLGLGCCAMAQSGLGYWRQGSAPAGARVGSGWYEQGRKWLWLRPLVAMGGDGYGHWKLSKTRARVGRALRRLGMGGDEVNK